MISAIALMTALLIQSADPLPISEINAHRVMEPVHIDGKLDETAWRQAEPVSGFYQFRPLPGEPSNELTEVRVLYDDRNLYIGMRMYADSDDITARLGRKDDEGLKTDWAIVMIDADLDRRNAFRFYLNPMGGRKDGLVIRDNQFDPNWSGVWEGASHIDDEGWTAEFRIPFSQLNISASEVEETLMGINFGRENVNRNELSYWIEAHPGRPRLVSLFGSLQGVQFSDPPTGLEVVPYLSAQTETFSDGSSADFSAQGGADLRYGLGNGFTLAAAINPDFGQVEVDPAVVNLTEFEVFFPEKRPFFLEGNTAFQFGRTPNVVRVLHGVRLQGQEGPLYTRRIGRPPVGTGPDDTDDSVIPGSTRIIGASKIVGRTQSGYSVGVLNAVTERVSGEILNGNGTSRFVAEPLASYSSARISKDYRQGMSSVGLIGTAVNREGIDGDSDFLPTAAYSFGLDGRHRFMEGDYEVAGWFLMSNVRGEPGVIQDLQEQPGRYYQRPDASHLNLDPNRQSLSGVAGSVGIGKQGGENWRGGVQYETRSPGFDLNQMGYLRNTDWHMAGTWLGYVSYNPTSWITSTSLFGNLYSEWDWSGEHLGTGTNVNTFTLFSNNWWYEGGIEYNFESLDTDVMRGGPAVLSEPLFFIWNNIATDQGRSASIHLSSSHTIKQQTDGFVQNYLAIISIMPFSRVSFSITPSVRWETNPWQWVGTADRTDTGSTEFITGKMEQFTGAVNLRVSVAPRSDLSFDLFTQPLVNRSVFTDYRTLSDPRAGNFENRFELIPADRIEVTGTDSDGREQFRVLNSDGEEAFQFDDAGFSLKSLRLNAVVRWEYRPGSELFLVWQQGRQELSPLAEPVSAGRLYRNIGDLPHDNIFLVKATYWFGR